MAGRRWADSARGWPTSEWAMFGDSAAGLVSTATAGAVRLSFAVCVFSVCANARGAIVSVNRSDAIRKRTIWCVMFAGYRADERRSAVL